MKNNIIGAALAPALLAPITVNTNNTSLCTAITAEAANVPQANLHAADKGLVDSGFGNLVGIAQYKWTYMGNGKVFQADNKIYHGNSVKVFYTKLPNIKPIIFNNKLVKNIYVWNCQEMCSRRIPKILDRQESGSVVSQPS